MAADNEVIIHIEEDGSEPSQSPGGAPQSPPAQAPSPVSQTGGSGSPRAQSPTDKTGNKASELFGSAFTRSLEQIVGQRIIKFFEGLFDVDLQSKVTKAASSILTSAPKSTKYEAPPPDQGAPGTPVAQSPQEPPTSTATPTAQPTSPTATQPTSPPPQAPSPASAGPVAASSGAGGGTPVAAAAGGSGAGVPPVAAATAAVEAGSLGGPVGIAIAASLVVAIGGSIIAFKLLSNTIQKIDRELEGVISPLRELSGSIALASAQNQIKEIESQLRRASYVDKDLSAIESDRGDIKALLTDINTQLLRIILPVVKEGADTLKAALRTVEPAVRIIANLEGLSGGAFKLMKDNWKGQQVILELLSKYLGIIADNTATDEEDAADRYEKEIGKFIAGLRDRPGVPVVRGPVIPRGVFR